jgi:lactoylglutathione lyase
MRLTHTRLLVSDFDACLHFYRDTLGLPCTLLVEGGIYAEFETGGALLALYRRDLMANVLGTGDRPAHATSQDNVALTFDVDNVDALYHQLSERGVKFITEPVDNEAWVLRVAHFRDPEGNLIEINHSLHS